jgi:hypothetical protein
MADREQREPGGAEHDASAGGRREQRGQHDDGRDGERSERQR